MPISELPLSSTLAVTSRARLLALVFTNILNWRKLIELIPSWGLEMVFFSCHYFTFCL